MLRPVKYVLEKDHIPRITEEYMLIVLTVFMKEHVIQWKPKGLSIELKSCPQITSMEVDNSTLSKSLFVIPVN